MLCVLKGDPLLWCGQHMFCTIVLLNHTVRFNIELNFAVLANVSLHRDYHKLHKPLF